MKEAELHGNTSELIRRVRQKPIIWTSKFRFIADPKVRTSAPSPIVLSPHELIVFLGVVLPQTSLSKISAVKINTDRENFFNFQWMNVVGNDLFLQANNPNNVSSIGQRGMLPTFAMFNAGIGSLAIAGFEPETKLKHSLKSLECEFRIRGNDIELDKYTVPAYSKYFNQEFHTSASATKFERKIYIAAGQEWQTDGDHLTPITDLYEFDTQSGTIDKIMIPIDCPRIGVARPTRIEFGGVELLFYSCREYGNVYRSEVARLSQGSWLKIDQIFNGLCHDQDLAPSVYQVPFIWNSELWSVTCQDYRGTLGFELGRISLD